MNILKVPASILRNRRDRLIALGTLITVGVVAAVGAFLFVSLGGVDVAASNPHSHLTYTLLHYAFNRTVDVRSSEYLPPVDLDSASRVRLGAQHFHLVCSNCHGGPGLGQSPVALSMTPRPQSLPAVVKQFGDRELFWIVKHGVKFSAMPAWPNQSRDDEVWSMVAFLKQLPTMSAQSYLDMTSIQPHQEGHPQIAFKVPTAPTPADTRRNTYPADEFLYASPAVGFGDQGLMNDPIAACSRCHGREGTGSATGGEAPNLTLQKADYLRLALQAYADGRRASGFMQPVAAALSKDQIEALATYYSGLGAKPASPEPGDAAVMDRGQLIVSQGIKETALPACGLCHESAAGDRIGAPHLKGQQRTYLIRQLSAMRNDDRGSTVAWNPMPAEAHGLNNADIVAVATWYAAQAPAMAPAATASVGETAQTVVATAGGTGDAAKGEAKFAEICSKCHEKGAIGSPDGEVPNLTIQTPAYATQALRQYRAGVRDNVKMKLVASSLSDGDIDNLTAYLGGLPAQPSKTTPDAASVARGEAIARDGIRDRAVPACSGCHNADMTAALPLIARLEGQNQLYMTGQLAYFASAEAERLSALNPMPAIARSLTAREQSDLAAYFAAEPPSPKPQPAQAAGTTN